MRTPRRPFRPRLLALAVAAALAACGGPGDHPRPAPSGGPPPEQRGSSELVPPAPPVVDAVQMPAREEMVHTMDFSGQGTSGGVAVGVTAGVAQDASGRAHPGDVPAGGDREGYAHLDENRFLEVASSPLSTFAIDVDAASYANVRRFLDSGALPPRGAVRIEELVNYFPYAYDAPWGDAPFAIHTEVAAAPWSPGHRLVRIGIQGRRIDTAELPPSNLTFLVDVSGSMNDPRKLPLLKSALRLLVEQLREEDRVAIVVYAGAAGVVLPSTSGADRGAILGALERLEAGGSTAGGQGLRLAYRVARESFRRGGNNRVILATDGDFNVGVSSDAEMVRLVEEERGDGIFLTVLGFGTGNYQDAKMEALADHGNGNYAYVDGLAEARKVLVTEMGGTLVTIAKDVKVQVEWNPALVASYRLIGYENRLLAAEDFNDDRKDGGELGAGHSVTALYEVVPRGAEGGRSGVDPLRYQRAVPRAAAASGELLTVKLRYKEPTGDESRLLARTLADRPTPMEAASADFRFAAAVAQWGMLLRGSEHRGEASYGSVLSLAGSALGEDRHGYRAEFVTLVQRSRGLAAASQEGEGEGHRHGGR
jgi:Ca-activated chloride channel family protein